MWSMHRHQRRDSAELFVSTSHDPLLRLPLSRSQFMLRRSRYMLCRSQYILCRPQYILCRSSTFVTHTQCHRHPIKIENSHTRAVGTNKSQQSSEACLRPACEFTEITYTLGWAGS